MRLIVLTIALLTVGGGYGPPAPPIAATARPTADGHVITWEVSDDADGWRVLVGATEVWRAPWYLHPGTAEAVAVAAGLWRPGEAVTVCATWAPDEEEPDAPPAVEHCQAVVPRLRVWLPVVRHGLLSSSSPPSAAAR